MSHASGADTTKLVTTTAGIQKVAYGVVAGMLKTETRPTPKMTALTMQKIRAATLSLARPLFLMGYRVLCFLVGQQPNEQFVSNRITGHIGFGQQASIVCKVFAANEVIHISIHGQTPKLTEAKQGEFPVNERCWRRGADRAAWALVGWRL